MVRFDDTLYIKEQITDAEFAEMIDMAMVNGLTPRQLQIQFHLRGWLIGRQWGDPHDQLVAKFNRICDDNDLLAEPFREILRNCNFAYQFELEIGIDTLQAIVDFMSFAGVTKREYREHLEQLSEETYQIVDNVIEISDRSHGVFVGMNSEFVQTYESGETTANFETQMQNMVEGTVYSFVHEFRKQKGAFNDE